MKQERIRRLNDKEYTEGPILYWIDRDMRLKDNWAVIAAQKLAKQHETPFGTLYNLVPNYLNGGRRQLQFKTEGLRELEESAAKKNIPFFVMTKEVTKELPKFIKEHGIGMLITDFNPLRENTKWKKEIAKKINIPFLQVDAHNTIPCWYVSPKQEFAAYTFRPKVHKALKEFLDEFPSISKQKKSWGKFPKTNWREVEALKTNEKVKAVDWVHGGEKEAHKMLKSFFEKRADGYAEKRNDPNEDNLSNLSPFLHYGNISAQRAVQEAKEALRERKMRKEDFDSFVEELVVRRELSDNFCFYNENYDSCRGFPEWALKTLGEHAKDKREYVYSKKEFEEAKTHDDLWNAAQMQMVKTGKMHGYMRMYWAKKILEWTNTITYAMEVAVYLNDKYELDGRDPNGYVGCAWSIGGVHDRAWFERPVYGKIRYMNANGAKKKFDVEKYISTWLD